MAKVSREHKRLLFSAGIDALKAVDLLDFIIEDLKDAEDSEGGELCDHVQVIKAELKRCARACHRLSKQ